ncbi:hypothetical protein RJ641_027477 [Dillenia turbinata]|uniref:Uncharacterized protein n=1 Tax=Dillenia turbinata TaxID=194707 RepID=A0AAN8VYB5_9MAGN
MIDKFDYDMQVARDKIEQAKCIKQKLTSAPAVGPANPTTNPPVEPPRLAEHNLPPLQPSSTPPQALPVTQPVNSFAPSSSEGENKKARAAAVAAKLAASTSSAQMLTSILSSLVAEEAASLNGGSRLAGVSSPGLTIFPPEKRPKLEKPSVPLLPQSMTSTSTSIQHMSQANQGQSPFQSQPPLPPPPPPPPPSANPPGNLFVQSAGLMVGTMPYGFGSNTLPPPPPLPSHVGGLSLARPVSQLPQLQQQALQQQQPSTGGFYRPPGIGFYGQNHQPSTQPVPRQ